MKAEDILGKKGTDIVTGHNGLCVSVCTSMYRELEVAIQPLKVAEEYPEMKWFAASQLLIEEKIK